MSHLQDRLLQDVEAPLSRMELRNHIINFIKAIYYAIALPAPAKVFQGAPLLVIDWELIIIVSSILLINNTPSFLPKVSAMEKLH
jgi:hypothetical protein